MSSSIMNKEVSLGTVKGIPVQLHASFFLLLFVQVISSIKVFTIAPLYLLFVIILYGPILLLTVVIHELGHGLMNQKLGGTADKILLWPLGGFTMCSPLSGAGVIGDLKVAVAGPMMHFPQMFVWFVFYAMFSGGDFTYFQPEVFLDIMMSGFAGFMSVLCSMAFFVNLFIFAFNFFIPAYPLDGGRCMAATLILLGMSVKQSAMITSVTAMAVAVLLLILGMISFFSESNPNGLFTVLISVYILIAGKHLYDMASSGRAKEHPLFNRPCYDERVTTIEQAIEENAAREDGTEMTGPTMA